MLGRVIKVRVYGLLSYIIIKVVHTVRTINISNLLSLSLSRLSRSLQRYALYECLPRLTGCLIVKQVMLRNLQIAQITRCAYTPKYATAHPK